MMPKYDPWHISANTTTAWHSHVMVTHLEQDIIIIGGRREGVAQSDAGFARLLVDEPAAHLMSGLTDRRSSPIAPTPEWPGPDDHSAAASLLRQRIDPSRTTTKRIRLAQTDRAASIRLRV
jgi:hypothetical protein